MLRGDYKIVNGEDIHGFDNLISVGVAYAFGKRDSMSTARPAATSPTMMDSDGDGVPDSSDACANTLPASRSIVAAVKSTATVMAWWIRVTTVRTPRPPWL